MEKFVIVIEKHDSRGKVKSSQTIGPYNRWQSADDARCSWSELGYESWVEKLVPPGPVARNVHETE